MKKLSILFALSVLTITLYGQIITFSDPGLKDFLINVACVDTSTTATWLGQFDVDLNNDNEIQLSEALSVQKLIIQDTSGTHSIQLLDDLVHFENLISLSVRMPILEFDNIQLDSLKSLSIIDIGTITKIDISNLPNLTDAIQIDGITTLDTLNIQNGSSASLFSLFYTQNVKYACVDSIAREYDAFYTFGAMLPGALPSIDCSTTSTADEVEDKTELFIFPNPTSGLIQLVSSYSIEELHILNTIGETVFRTRNLEPPIDLSALDSGMYIFKIRIQGSYLLRRIIVN